MGIYGQDWASYQPAAPDTSGLSFALVKVTEGLSYINPRWIQQRDHAKAAGLVWGGYHYPHMANDPVTEADFFLSQVAWQPGDLIVLDWEGYDTANRNVSRSRQLAYRDAWLKHVKGRMASHQVGLYCNTDYWLNVDQTGNCGDFLWIATTCRAAGDPGIKAPWMFHQYSTANGVDHDYCPLPSKDALRTWALGTNTPTPTNGSDMQPSDDITLGAWIPQTWPDDAGLTDGKISVGTALGSGYAHARLAKENSFKILDLLAQAKTAEAAQTAAITALAAKVGTGVDTATVVKAVQDAIAAAVVNVHVDVTGGTGTTTSGA